MSIAALKSWMEEDLCTNLQNVLRVDQDEDDYYLCRFYTSLYRYTIVAKQHKDGRTYLGCTVSTRMPLAGEDIVRGNDLADGSIERKTWNQILRDVVRFEIVQLATQPAVDMSVPGPVAEVTS